MKPHFGHLYGRPNLRHFVQRFIWISPQLGHRNFVASTAGGIGLPQLVQETSVIVSVLSVIGTNSMMALLKQDFLISCMFCLSQVYYQAFNHCFTVPHWESTSVLLSLKPS
jgi:hypothetical protein